MANEKKEEVKDENVECVPGDNLETPCAEKDEELSLNKKSKFVKIIKAILAKMAFLKKKRFWIPLVIGHLLMFAGTGYFAHYQLTKVNKPSYLVSSLQQSLSTNNASLFNSLIDVQVFTKNFIISLLNDIQKYKHLYIYMGEIPATDVIKDHVSLFLLDIIKGKEYTSDFNTKTQFIPKDIASQLVASPFTISATEEAKTYILTTEVYHPKWERLPIKLQVILTDNGLKIVKLANLDELLQIYNYVLSKDFQSKQNNKNIATRRESYSISKYISAPTCTAQLGEIAGNYNLFIELKAEPNYQTSEIVSFATEIYISNEKNQVLLQKELKTNKLFMPKTPIQTSWNVPLTIEEVQKIKNNKELICEAVPVMVNAKNGDYFDVRKK